MSELKMIKTGNLISICVFGFLLFCYEVVSVATLLFLTLANLAHRDKILLLYGLNRTLVSGEQLSCTAGSQTMQGAMNKEKYVTFARCMAH